MKKALATTLTAILICSMFAAPAALAAGEDWVQTDTIPEETYYFSYPCGVATDASGNIYVADRSLNRVKKYRPDGVLDTNWCGDGILGGKYMGGIDEFKPAAIAVDASGNLYIADSGHDRVIRYNPSGLCDIGWGGAGVVGGFDEPSGLAIDASGKMYVADSGNDCIKRYSNLGLLDTEWGSSGSIGGLNTPRGIAVDTSSGKLYIADTLNHRVVRYNLDGTLDTAWGSSGTIGTGSSGNSVNEFSGPYGVAVDTSGCLYVVDTHNCRIKKYTPGGSLDVSWGSNGIIGSRGAGPEDFEYEKGIAVDADGNLFVADTDNKRIKKYKSDGELDTTWCLDGIMATSIGAGQIDYPSGATMDSMGRLYVVDTYNFRVARYTCSGELDTAWGTGGYIGTGAPGSGNDEFCIPSYVAVDSDGNIYVSDTENHRIKRYTGTGVLDTSWASGGILSEPEGTGSDEMLSPTGVAVDSSGNLYVADKDNRRVKRYTPGGVRDTSWGGDGIIGQSGDAAERFSEPSGLAVMPDGTLFVADTRSERIKSYTPQGELNISWGGDGIEYGSAALGGFSDPKDLTVNPDTGEVYVADMSNRRVIRFSPDGTDQELFWQSVDETIENTDNPFGGPLSIDYYNGRLVIASQQKMVVLTDVTGGVKLGDLTVFGETVHGFDPDTHEYTVVVSKNATQVEVGAAPEDIFSTVSGTGTRTLNTGSSTQLSLTVTAAAQGYSADYTLNVLRGGEDVGLTGLTVDGSTVPGFREDDTSYTITAPYGARYVDIGAVGNSCCEEIAGTGVVKLTGDSTPFSVVAKAVDGSAKEYTLTVRKGSLEATTFDVSLNGTLFGIDGISVTVPNDGSKTVLIRVTLSDGSYMDFPITITALGDDDADPATPTPKPTATPTPKPTATSTSKPTVTSTSKPTVTSTPKPTATSTSTAYIHKPTVKPTGAPTSESVDAPTSTPTSTPASTPTSTQSDESEPTPTQTKAPGKVAVIPKEISQDEETGVFTVIIDISDLPEGTVAVQTPDGAVLYISDAKNGEIMIEVTEDDINADGEIEIIALDNEMTALAAVHVQVLSENDELVIAKADETAGSVWVIVVCIAAGVIVIGLAVLWILRRRNMKI